MDQAGVGHRPVQVVRERLGAMAVLAEPQQAGEVAGVRVALIEYAGLVAPNELVDRQAGAPPYLALEADPR